MDNIISKDDFGQKSKIKLSKSYKLHLRNGYYDFIKQELNLPDSLGNKKKIHITLRCQNEENYYSASQEILNLLMAYSISTFKFFTWERKIRQETKGKEPEELGKDLTIYAYNDPDLDWNNILNEINNIRVKYCTRGIQERPFFDMPLLIGMASIRNESMPYELAIKEKKYPKHKDYIETTALWGYYINKLNVVSDETPLFTREYVSFFEKNGIEFYKNPNLLWEKIVCIYDLMNQDICSFQKNSFQETILKNIDFSEIKKRRNLIKVTFENINEIPPLEEILINIRKNEKLWQEKGHSSSSSSRRSSADSENPQNTEHNISIQLRLATELKAISDILSSSSTNGEYKAEIMEHRALQPLISCIKSGELITNNLQSENRGMLSNYPYHFLASGKIDEFSKSTSTTEMKKK